MEMSEVGPLSGLSRYFYTYTHNAAATNYDRAACFSSLKLQEIKFALWELSPTRRRVGRP